MKEGAGGLRMPVDAPGNGITDLGLMELVACIPLLLNPDDDVELFSEVPPTD